MILKIEKNEEDNHNEEVKDELPQGTPDYDTYHLNGVVSTLGGDGELRYS